ncbi:MAG: DUF2807 domain-containing protein [Bacteroidales bacterium]|nr:DUF2807 domain-containing protein [Bacteroidales bacterium]
MKNILGIALFAALMLSCGGTVVPELINGTGKIAHSEFDISATYTELHVSRGIKVVLVEPGNGRGTITAGEAVIEHVSIVENDGVVRVTYAPNKARIRPKTGAVVTMPLSGNLRKIDVSSAGRVVCDNVIRAHNMHIDLSSAAHVDLSIQGDELDVEMSSAANALLSVNCTRIGVDLSSAAKCTIRGVVSELGVDAGSAARFRGFELASSHAKLESSSGGNVEAAVGKTLDVDVSSGALIRYKGSPQIMNQRVSSGGSLRSVQ